MSASTNKKSNPSSTEHWQSARWSVEVKSGAHISTLDLRRPFALVGSHRCCHLRVSSRRVPDVAFFICCFGEQVEAWELPCHETMTGRILTPDLPLEVGPCSLTFSPRTVDDQENQTSPRFQVSTQLDSGGNSQIQPKDQDIETGSETLPPSVEIHCDENTGQHANDVSSDPTYDHSLGMSDSAVETP